MRYFVEEAPKELVPLKAELDFIQDYIEVERIRLPHNLEICWERNAQHNEQILIPPILFIPLVENVFKHGVDKTKENNKIAISVEVESNALTFTVKNSLHSNQNDKSKGTGLVNLRKRLTLLFNSNFNLQTGPESSYYVAKLKIPL